MIQNVAHLRGVSKFLPEGVSFDVEFNKFIWTPYARFEDYLTDRFPKEMATWKAAWRVTHGI